MGANSVRNPARTRDAPRPVAHPLPVHSQVANEAHHGHTDVNASDPHSAKLSENNERLSRHLAELAGSLRDDQNPATRIDALRQLERFDSKAAISVVGVALGGKEPSVREAALFTLASQGALALHLLGQAVIGDPDPILRSLALDLLSANDSPAAWSLVEAALDDEEPEVRQIAAKLLETRAIQPESTVVNESLVVDFSDSELVTDFIDDALNSELVEPALSAGEIVKLATGADDPLWRIDVVDALAWRAEQDANPALVAGLAAALADPDVDVREHAVTGLGRGAQRRTDLVGQALLGDGATTIRLEAAAWLAEDPTPVELAMLAAASEDADPEVRNFVREVLNDFPG